MGIIVGLVFLALIFWAFAHFVLAAGLTTTEAVRGAERRQMPCRKGCHATNQITQLVTRLPSTARGPYRRTAGDRTTPRDAVE